MGPLSGEPVCLVPSSSPASHTTPHHIACLLPLVWILQKEFERRVDPNDKNAQNLLDEMRQHIKKLEDMRKNEDPRLSFSTPEFKEAQRTFTDGFKKNFGKPVEWGLVKDYAWSTPQLRKLDEPVDVNGKPIAKP